MDVLITPLWQESLEQQGGKLLARYPQRLLMELPQPPRDIPAGEYEILSDNRIRANGNWVEIPAGSFDQSTTPRTLLRFRGPYPANLENQLKQLGIRLLFYCPRFGACVQLPNTLKGPQLQQALPLCVGSRAYVAEMCSRHVAPSDQTSPLMQAAADMVDLVCFRKEDTQRLQHDLAQQGIIASAISDYKIRLSGGASLDKLRKISGVKLADPVRVASLCQTTLESSIGAPTRDSEMGAMTLNGTGQIVAVADTGLDRGQNDDSLHPDFHKRVKAILSWPLQADWSAYFSNTGNDDGAADRNNGHGTHVAGLALGDGSKSSGRYRGIASGATLVFQAIEQYSEVKPEHRTNLSSGHYLTGKPLDLRQLFQQARDQGARIHINAWGDAAAGQYTDDCYETDYFLKQNSDALILFAAGNSGADLDGNRIIDQSSLYAPASAKNVLAIGATEGGDAGVGLRLTWGQFNSNLFRNPADQRDPLSGEPDRVALFSSAGPSRDGRIKPELCAPGTNLAAPRSQASAQSGWGLAPPLPYYMYNGGTSMAVGVAGGAAAVVRQAWQQQLSRAPSGAALKALLILGAAQVISRRDNQPEPRHVAGFGRLLISQSLPQQPGLDITLHDISSNGLQSGEQHDYPIHIQSGGLRAVLSWYDLPGEQLINDLNLCLIDRHSQIIWGNHPPGQAGEPDHANNTEVIDCPILAPGNYILRVRGNNIARGPQAYALVTRQQHSDIPEQTAIPLVVIKGLDKRIANRLKPLGIEQLQQLLAQTPEQIRSLPLTSSKCDTLAAQLQLLKQQRAQLAELGLWQSQLMLAQIIYGDERPEAINSQTWQRLRDLCQPLVLIFNKGALTHIPLQQLL